MTRLLGIDLGERRIGIAVAEDGPARPLTTLRRGRTTADDAAAIREIALAHGVDGVVVGLPLDMSGEEGPQAAATRKWAGELEPALALPIVLRDERLTSHVAETRIGPMPRGRSGGPPTPTQRERHRARIDREAAAVILQDELDARSTASAELSARGPRAVAP